MSVGPIYIVGMKHSGKSSVGRRVAYQLATQFSDLDSEIEAIFREESGISQPVRTIYRNGPDEFVRLETLACRRVAAKGRQIVATGGGVCDNDEAVTILRGGYCILLDEDCEVLIERVMRRGVPPFLGTEDPGVARKRFAELYERRMTKYLEMADITVDQRGLSMPEVVAIVADRVEEHVVGWK